MDIVSVFNKPVFFLKILLRYKSLLHFTSFPPPIHARTKSPYRAYTFREQNVSLQIYIYKFEGNPVLEPAMKKHPRESRCEKKRRGGGGIVIIFILLFRAIHAGGCNHGNLEIRATYLL